MRVYELPPHLFEGAAALLGGIWFDEPMIGATLERRQPARVFVDDPRAPAAALLCHRYDYYLAGEARPALRRFIADAPEEAAVFGQVYGYCPAGRGWESSLLSDADGRLVVIPRRSFKYRRPSPPTAGPLAPAAKVQTVDRALAAQIDRHFARAISRNWGDPASFQRHAFGYCITVGNAVATIALPAAVSARFADLDIETAPAYRRQGLAYQACAAFIAEGLARGLTICWDADGPNLASAALAVKLGFQEEAPFSELATPDRTPPPQSRGRWRAQAAPDGVTEWIGAE
jgi:RimJ/RimL family protein N-acetyltransferase